MNFTIQSLNSNLEWMIDQFEERIYNTNEILGLFYWRYMELNEAILIENSCVILWANSNLVKYNYSYLRNKFNIRKLRLLKELII